MKGAPAACSWATSASVSASAPFPSRRPAPLQRGTRRSGWPRSVRAWASHAAASGVTRPDSRSAMGPADTPSILPRTAEAPRTSAVPAASRNDLALALAGHAHVTGGAAGTAAHELVGRAFARHALAV